MAPNGVLMGVIGVLMGPNGVLMGVTGGFGAAMGTWTTMGQPSHCCESSGGGLMGVIGVLMGS